MGQILRWLLQEWYFVESWKTGTCEVVQILGEVVSTESESSHEQARTVSRRSEDLSPRPMFWWEQEAKRWSTFHNSATTPGQELSDGVGHFEKMKKVTPPLPSPSDDDMIVEDDHVMGKRKFLMRMCGLSSRFLQRSKREKKSSHSNKVPANYQSGDNEEQKTGRKITSSSSWTVMDNHPLINYDCTKTLLLEGSYMTPYEHFPWVLFEIRSFSSELTFGWNKLIVKLESCSLRRSRQRHHQANAGQSVGPVDFLKNKVKMVGSGVTPPSLRPWISVLPWKSRTLLTLTIGAPNLIRVQRRNPCGGCGYNQFCQFSRSQVRRWRPVLPATKSPKLIPEIFPNL